MFRDHRNGGDFKKEMNKKNTATSFLLVLFYSGKRKEQIIKHKFILSIKKF
jgi:hypothetical protein